MATYGPPAVPVFPAGYGPQATDFNTWWYQNAAFFQNRVVFRASQATTATTLPSSAALETITYDNIIEDPYAGWDSLTHLWNAPAGYSGWYQVTITIRTVTVANLVDVRAAITGTWSYLLTSLEGASANPAGCCATFGVYLTGGQDDVGAQAQVLNSGVNVNTSLTSGQQSSLEIVWLSQS